MIKQSKFSKYLRAGEVLLKAYQSHGASYIGSWVLGALLMASSFFLLWPLLNLGVGGLVIWLTLLISSLAILWRTLILWRGNILLLTNDRLIDINHSGLISQTVSQTTYKDIQDVSWTKSGLGSAIFGYGSVQLVCANGSIRLVFPHLADPAGVSSDIITIREKGRSSNNLLSAQQNLTPKERELLVKEIYSGGHDYK